MITRNAIVLECDRSSCSEYAVMAGEESYHPVYPRKPDDWFIVQYGGEERCFCSDGCMYAYTGSRLGGGWLRSNQDLLEGRE